MGIKIAILTDFRSDDHSYSLCNVVNEQIKFLISNGYKPKVLVTEGFKPSRAYKDAELLELPDQSRHNTVTVDDTFEEDVKKIEEKMDEHLKDVDIVITHDTIYQPASLKHNMAIRRLAERTNLRFMHWIHSAVSPMRLAKQVGKFVDEYKKVLEKPFPRSYYVFFNSWSIPRIAKVYDIPQSVVKVVNHPTDYTDFCGYHDISKQVVDKYNLLDKDYICYYPARLDRGKQLQYPIKLMGALKKMKFDVMFLALDFHSTSDNPEDLKFQYRNDLKKVAKEWGLDETEYMFMSEFMPETKSSSPKEVVRDIADISNIFFMSSSSESYSLVTQEAAMMGNLLIVSSNYPPFVEIFGPDVVEFPCDSAVQVLDRVEGSTVTKLPEGEEKRYRELAKEVVAHLSTYQERTRRMLLRQRNPHAIFTMQLEPLFYKIMKEYE